MRLPEDVKHIVEAHLDQSIRSEQPVGGGCIANATRIETSSGPYFLKWSREEAACTFPPEAAGLEALRSADSPLVIPEPICATDSDDGGPGILLMEWIEAGEKSPHFWEEFGRGLARLHRHVSDRYGFDQDNFIGRLPQRNTWSSYWIDFYVSERLEPQVRMAQTHERWNPSWAASFTRFVRALDDLLPQNPEPSILHGDLWSGNFLVAANGNAALVDPAAYFGHREADLGMTRLFGGYNPEFYDAYLEAWPLESGYAERFEIYNLYHLLNHLNHFGAGYAGSVDAILRKF